MVDLRAPHDDRPAYSARTVVFANIKCRSAGSDRVHEDDDVALPTSGSTRRTRARRALSALIAVVVLAGGLAGAYVLGIRLNVQTRSVAVPTAAASPEEVVRVYIEAYNHRDFATMTTIYPSQQGAFSRFRAMGTMHHLRIVSSRVATEDDLAGTFPKAGHSYHRVEVTFDYTGLTGSDLTYQDGPSGSTYWLERSSTDQAWTITDQGF